METIRLIEINEHKSLYEVVYEKEPHYWMTHPSNGGSQVYPSSYLSKGCLRVLNRVEEYHFCLCSDGGNISWFETMEEITKFLTVYMRYTIKEDVI